MLIGVCVVCRQIQLSHTYERSVIALFREQKKKKKTQPLACLCSKNTVKLVMRKASSQQLAKIS